MAGAPFQTGVGLVYPGLVKVNQNMADLDDSLRFARFPGNSLCRPFRFQVVIDAKFFPDRRLALFHCSGANKVSKKL